MLSSPERSADANPARGMRERLLQSASNGVELGDVALDLREPGVVTLSLVESALGELEATLEALLGAREQQQRVRSRGPARNFLCEALENRCALGQVSGGKVIPGRLDLPVQQPVSSRRRGQANRELGQLRRGRRCATSRRHACGLVEGAGGVLARLSGAERQVPGPLLGVADRLGEPAVQTLPLHGPDRRIGGGGK